MSSANPSQLQSLARFRKFSILAAAVCVALSLVSFWWLPLRIALLFGVVVVYFLVLAMRTHAMWFQISHGSPPSFNRPAPEWITGLFALGFIIVAFWPR